MNISKHVLVTPGHKVKLDDDSAGTTFGVKKDLDLLKKNIDHLRELQLLLYADKRYALLIVLQGLDAGGKDGTIRHVMSGVNPQGCTVTSFKAPNEQELAHDYLWRVHQAVPPRGNIGIFNRSQYEDVLVVRVHNLVDKSVWSKRYDQINNFEEMLTENGVVILKFFLHISKDEQKKRFEERLNNPEKNWKLSLPDFKEREHWDEYIAAYEDALTKCSTKQAPWYIIPSDKKWFRNYAISTIVTETLDKMKLRFPAASVDLSEIHFK